MLRPLTRVCAITAAILAASTAPAVAAEVPAIGGVSARPIAADGSPLPGAYFDVEQAPASSFDAHVLVTNSTDRPIPVHVAAVDTTTSDNGGTAFLATRAPRTLVGTWISPGRQSLTLGAGSSTRLNFRVRIPGNSRPGDHVGGIVIEPDRKVRVGSSADITRVVRVALAVRVRVPGEARLSLGVDRLRFSRDADSGRERPTLTVQLTNDGERLCRPYLTATFSTNSGVQTAERRHVDTLLPKTTADFAMRWSRPVPDGAYDVRVRTEGCGAPSAVTENVVLDSAGDVTVAGATPSTPAGRAGISTAAQRGSIAALVIAAALAGWWLARRRPRRSTR